MNSQTVSGSESLSPQGRELLESECQKILNPTITRLLNRCGEQLADGFRAVGLPCVVVPLQGGFILRVAGVSVALNLVGSVEEPDFGPCAFVAGLDGQLVEGCGSVVLELKGPAPMDAAKGCGVQKVEITRKIGGVQGTVGGGGAFDVGCTCPETLFGVLDLCDFCIRLSRESVLKNESGKLVALWIEQRKIQRKGIPLPLVLRAIVERSAAESGAPSGFVESLFASSDNLGSVEVENNLFTQKAT